MYLTAKLQPWHVPHFLENSYAAEGMVLPVSVHCRCRHSLCTRLPRQPHQLAFMARTYRRTPLPPYADPPPVPHPMQCSCHNQSRCAVFVRHPACICSQPTGRSRLVRKLLKAGLCHKAFNMLNCAACMQGSSFRRQRHKSLQTAKKAHTMKIWTIRPILACCMSETTTERISLLAPDLNCHFRRWSLGRLLLQAALASTAGHAAEPGEAALSRDSRRQLWPQLRYSFELADPQRVSCAGRGAHLCGWHRCSHPSSWAHLSSMWGRIPWWGWRNGAPALLGLKENVRWQQLADSSASSPTAKAA